MPDKPIRDEAMREAERLMHEYHSASPVAKNLILMIATALDNFQAARAKPTQDVAGEAKRLAARALGSIDCTGCWQNKEGHQRYVALITTALQAARDEGARQSQDEIARLRDWEDMQGKRIVELMDERDELRKTSKTPPASAGAAEKESQHKLGCICVKCEDARRKTDAQEPLGAKGRLNSLEHGNAPLPASASPSGLVEGEEVAIRKWLKDLRANHALNETFNLTYIHFERLLELALAMAAPSGLIEAEEWATDKWFAQQWMGEQDGTRQDSVQRISAIIGSAISGAVDKAVPDEPTEEMVVAGDEEAIKVLNDTSFALKEPTLAHLVYKAMVAKSPLPSVSEVRWKAINEAADICEKMFIDSGWNSHYRNAAIKCSSAIRALIDKEKETP